MIQRTARSRSLVGHRSCESATVRHLEQTYDFEDDEALLRRRALSDYWHVKHGILTTWDGASGRLRGRKMGVKYDARVVVGGGKVTAQVDAGFLAEKLGAPGYVERKVADYLDPAHSLEALRARVPGS